MASPTDVMCRTGSQKSGNWSGGGDISAMFDRALNFNAEHAMPPSEFGHPKAEASTSGSSADDSSSTAAR